MLRMILGLAAVAVLACGLSAQEKPMGPKPPVLSSGTAKIEGDNLVCEVTVIRSVAVNRQETVVQAGKLVTVTRTAYVPEQYMQRRLIPLKGLQGYAISDKGADPTKRLQSLDPTKLAERLKTSPRVLFAWGNDKGLAEQTKELKEGSVILVLPREKQGPRPPLPSKE